MPDGSEFQIAGAATLKPRDAKVVGWLIIQAVRNNPQTLSWEDSDCRASTRHPVARETVSSVS